MKKFLFMLIMSIIALTLGTTVMSCDNIMKHDSSALLSKDSTMLMTAIDQYHNPQFTTTSDFCEYVADELNYYDFVQVAGKLHKNTILSVASSTLEKNGFVDYRTFLQEYCDNKQLYDNVDHVNKSSNVPIRLSSDITVHLDSVPPVSNQTTE